MWPNDWTDTTDEHEMREREQDERDESAFLDARNERFDLEFSPCEIWV